METRQIKYENHLLYLKIGEQTIVLGKINTKQGKLTKSQKLKAVEFKGQWVTI